MADPSIRLYELEIQVTSASGVGHVYGGSISASDPAGRAVAALSGQYVDGKLTAPYPVSGRTGSALSGAVTGKVTAAYPVSGRIKELS